MKKFLFLLFIAGSFYSQAQIKTVDLSKKNVVYFGIDFTAARCIGQDGFSDPYAIVSTYFSRWNSLVLNESEKYNVKKCLGIMYMENDLEAVTDHNESVNYRELVINGRYSIDEKVVQEVISGLEIKTNPSKEEIGFVFVVESFNKLEERGFFWATLFDTKTKKVLATQRFSGKPGGFGLRNFWASSLHGAMEEMQAAR